MRRSLIAVTRVVVILGLVLVPQLSRASGSSSSNSNSTSSYGRDGYDQYGYDRDGRDKKGYDRSGYDRKGYDRDGYDRDGYDRGGRDRDGHDHDYKPSGQGHGNDDKVTICHKPGNGPGNTITVSQNAVPAHLGHGDTLGACSVSPSR